MSTNATQTAPNTIFQFGIDFWIKHFLSEYIPITICDIGIINQMMRKKFEIPFYYPFRLVIFILEHENKSKILLTWSP